MASDVEALLPSGQVTGGGGGCFAAGAGAGGHDRPRNVMTPLAHRNLARIQNGPSSEPGGGHSGEGPWLRGVTSPVTAGRTMSWGAVASLRRLLSGSPKPSVSAARAITAAMMNVRGSLIISSPCPKTLTLACTAFSERASGRLCSKVSPYPPAPQAIRLGGDPLVGVAVNMSCPNRVRAVEVSSTPARWVGIPTRW